MSKKVFVLGAIAALLGVLKWFKMLSNYKAKVLLLTKLIDIPVISVQQLLTKSSSYTGFVSGILDTFPGQYIPSKIVPGIKLLYSKLILSTYNLRNSASVYKTTVSEGISSILKLSDSRTGRSVKVLETLITNFGNSLDKLKSRTKKTSNFLQKNLKISLVQLLIILLVQVAIALSKYKNILLLLSSGFLSWYHSQIYQEYYLPPGKKAVIYGTFQLKKDEFYIQKPQFITKSKHDLISMLRYQTSISQRLLLLFGIGLTPLIGWVGYNLYKIIKEYIQNIRSFSVKDLEQLKQLKVTKYACPQCNNNIRNIISKQCNHLSHCKNCQCIADIKCSQCEQQVKNYVQVYVS